jgi:hypothetical protein
VQCGTVKLKAVKLAAAGTSTTTEPATVVQPAYADRPAEEAGFINEKEALRRVPVSRRTWYCWREEKGLPFIKLGGRVLYDWASVRQWLLRQQRAGE